MGTDRESPVQVSVLCLAYNHEKYIRQTLEGFVNQKTDFKFEVLIHDDASTDQTASIIAEYEARYPEIIKPIYQTENQHSKGVKIQRTFNFPRAKGKYFAWCEGDDYWCDEYKLQKQYNALDSYPECTICLHRVQCVNEDGSMNSRVIPEKYYGFIEGGGVLSDYDIADALWGKKKGYPFHTSSYFVRKEAISGVIAGILDFANNMNGDEALIRTALEAGHFYYINEVMSHRRLLSIGNYNSRLNKLSEIDRRILVLKMARGDLLYNEYTFGRFYKWIIRAVSDKVVNCGAFNQAMMDEFLVDTKLKKADVLKYCSVGNRLKYYLALYAHPIYKFLRRVDDSIKN